MKKFKYLALASVFALGMTSCGDFGDLNVNPESLNDGNIPFEMVFSNGQHQVMGSDWDGWRNACIHSSQWIQHMVSVDWWDGYGRYHWNDDYSAAYWTIFKGDRGAFRDITTCYDLWKDDDAHKVDYNMARVMRVYAGSKLTDLYGDIPYSQAGRPTDYAYPAYDSQKDIYMSMLQELDEAQANLTGTSTLGNHDLYFQGDVAKWKKFANSLMLRLAMRLVKVDEATAKQYAAKALANGLISSIDDNVKLEHSDGDYNNDSSEPFAKITGKEDKEFFLSKTFVDQLKNTNDPRLGLIATLCETNFNDGLNSATPDYGNTDPAVQEGLPVGGYNIAPSSPYFVGKIDSRFNDADFLANYGKHFSQPNRYTYAHYKSPSFIVTYAQTQLLLAEAAVRGYVSGDAKTYFENGLRAAMAQFTQFTQGEAPALYNTYLTDAAVNTYVSAQVTAFEAASAEGKKEIINTQYWINSFGDEYEAFGNWRRSGYPTLEVSPLVAQDGEAQSKIIPRRFRYPTSESQVNAENYNAAVGRLTGGDRFDSRVWWDK